MTTMVQVIFKIKCGGGKNLPISIITLLMKYLYKYYSLNSAVDFPQQ